mmetsp:Transcript_2222/g.5524  ORF Transcript_2222/g.5524 Transcript_2222/m.5524 type:complete len:210 (+) Transcript_2222:300-929(+)
MVSMRSSSPSSMKSGTMTTAPVSSVAGFSPPPLAVSPLTPGIVSATLRFICPGRSHAMNLPFHFCTDTTVPSLRKSSWSMALPSMRISSKLSISMNTYWSSPSLYVYCTSNFSTSACTTPSPARQVFSTELPVIRFFNLERTNAAPLPGLTCRNSTTLYGAPASSIVSPILKSLDVSIETAARGWKAETAARPQTHAPCTWPAAASTHA